MNVSSPHDTAFWFDLAAKYDKLSRKFDKREAELRAAHSQAEIIIDTYFDAGAGFCVPCCGDGTKYSGIANTMLYVLLAVMGLGFVNSLFYMVAQQSYDIPIIILVTALGVLTLVLIIIPIVICMRLRCRARRIMAEGKLPTYETLSALAQRLFSNPSLTFSERITQSLSGSSRMLIVPHHVPSYERMIKMSTMLTSFCLAHYSSIKKKLSPDDFREYLTAVMLLAMLDLENAELVNPAVLADVTS